jgi:hypothetical protein
LLPAIRDVREQNSGKMRRKPDGKFGRQFKEWQIRMLVGLLDNMIEVADRLMVVRCEAEDDRFHSREM